ncbi:MAG TPA: hypothetical protein VNF04_12220 [Stellaceae bacterium]|nr:hypothetical protein [Stellaceae bacterium]
MAERKHHFRKLNAAQRQHMPKSEFALPGKGEGPKGAGSGSYPIPDEAHARAALSRGAANASPAEQAEIKRKVHEKFPAIAIGGRSRSEKRYRGVTVRKG